MAVSNTNTGAIEWGAGSFTGLPTATALTLFPPQNPGTDNRNNTPFPVSVFGSHGGRQSLAIVLSVAANQAFNLDYQFTTDGGTTWYIGDQIASTTVTVDGGAAGFTQSATLNLQVGYQYRVQLWNGSGVNMNGAYEWRLYSDNA